jgi:hypothetical protein
MSAPITTVHVVRRAETDGPPLVFVDADQAKACAELLGAGAAAVDLITAQDGWSVYVALLEDAG